MARTHVLVRRDSPTVLGYHTLSAGSVPFDLLPSKAAKRLPKLPIPVLLLGRLGIDRSVQKQRLGLMTLMDALDKCVGVAERVGVVAVEVVAIDDATAAFYAKYGFAPLADQARHLFLPIEAARQVLPPRV